MAAKKALLADAIVPLYPALDRPHLQDSSDPNKERCRQPREGPKKGHKDDQRLQELGLISLEKRGLRGTSSQHYCTLRMSTRRPEDLSSQRSTWKRQRAISTGCTGRGFISI